jgi:general secretion pathway protein M
MSPFDRAHPIWKLLTRAHLVPLLGFASLILVLAAVTWFALTSLAGDYQDYTAASDLLDRIEGRKLGGDESGLGTALDKSGSPFIEGRTVTIAGAALQHRVVAAIEDAGGNVLSSQVDLQKFESKPGFISLSVNCEVEQASLQQLLYDLETGMPFLFIDQLVVQMPQSAAKFESGPDTPRMHVQIDVSGQWRMNK